MEFLKFKSFFFQIGWRQIYGNDLYKILTDQVSFFATDSQKLERNLLYSLIFQTVKMN